MPCPCCVLSPCNGCPDVPGTSSSLTLTSTAVYRPSGYPCSETAFGEAIPVSSTETFSQTYRATCQASGSSSYGNTYAVYLGVLDGACRVYLAFDYDQYCGCSLCYLTVSFDFAGTGTYNKTIYVHTYNRRPGGGATRVRITSSSTPPSDFSFGPPAIYESPNYFDYISTFQVSLLLALT